MEVLVAGRRGAALLKRYQRAYEDAIRATATKHAPWYVIPADHKWFTRLAVAAAVVDALAGLDLHYPKVDKSTRRQLAEARRELTTSDRKSRSNGTRSIRRTEDPGD